MQRNGNYLFNESTARADVAATLAPKRALGANAIELSASLSDDEDERDANMFLENVPARKIKLRVEPPVQVADGSEKARYANAPHNGDAHARRLSSQRDSFSRAPILSSSLHLNGNGAVSVADARSGAMSARSRFAASRRSSMQTSVSASQDDVYVSGTREFAPAKRKTATLALPVTSNGTISSRHSDADSNAGACAAVAKSHVDSERRRADNANGILSARSAPNRHSSGANGSAPAAPARRRVVVVDLTSMSSDDDDSSDEADSDAGKEKRATKNDTAKNGKNGSVRSEKGAPRNFIVKKEFGAQAWPATKRVDEHASAAKKRARKPDESTATSTNTTTTVTTTPSAAARSNGASESAVAAHDTVAVAAPPTKRQRRADTLTPPMRTPAQRFSSSKQTSSSAPKRQRSSWSYSKGSDVPPPATIITVSELELASSSVKKSGAVARARNAPSSARSGGGGGGGGAYKSSRVAKTTGGVKRGAKKARLSASDTPSTTNATKAAPAFSRSQSSGSRQTQTQTPSPPTPRTSSNTPSQTYSQRILSNDVSTSSDVESDERSAGHFHSDEDTSEDFQEPKRARKDTPDAPHPTPEDLATINNFFHRVTGPYKGCGTLTPMALHRCMNLMGLDENSVFVDLGSGPGNVLYPAVGHFKVREAIGLERDEDVVLQGQARQRFYAKMFPCFSRISVHECELRHLRRLPRRVTHVYSFDRIMRYQTLRHNARVLNRLRPQVFTSYHAPERWLALGLNAKCVAYLPACRTTGGESYTAYYYVFDNVDTTDAEENEEAAAAASRDGEANGDDARKERKERKEKEKRRDRDGSVHGDGDGAAHTTPSKTLIRSMADSARKTVSGFFGMMGSGGGGGDNDAAADSIDSALRRFADADEEEAAEAAVSAEPR